MRTILLSLLILLTALSTYGQKKNLFTISQEEIAKDIVATRYKTKYTIVDYHVDTNRNRILLLLDKVYSDGYSAVSIGMYTLTLVDVLNNNIVWEKHFHSINAIRHVCNDDVFIIYYPGKKSVCYNMQDAYVKWQTKEKIITIHSKLQLAVSASGAALDLETGKTKWKYPLEDRLDWSDLVYPNDSTAIIINNGIYCINLITGKGWNYPSITWSMGGALGDRKINHLCSNILLDSGKIYWASKKTLSCYDMDGSTRWQVPMPPDSISGSSLSADENGNIILYNAGIALEKSIYSYGWAANTNSIVNIPQLVMNWGKPFIASFARADGTRRSTIPLHGRNEMQSFITGDTLVVNEVEALYLYNITSGQLMIKKDKKNTLLENYPYLANERLAKSENNEFHSLSELYPDEYFLMNLNEEVLRITKNLETVDTFSAGATYTLSYKKDNLAFLDAVGKTHIVNNDKLIRTLKIKTPFVVGNKLVEISKNHFSIADTTGLF